MRVSLTTRASLLAGRSVWSTELNLMPANGRPSAIKNAALRAASGIGRRITKCENRYQKPEVPAAVIDHRKLIFNTVSEDTATAMVSELKNTVRPAVRIVMRTAGRTVFFS